MAVRPFGLLARSILASVLVAAVAIVATALLTMNATRDTLEREQVRVAEVDQEVVDELAAVGLQTDSWDAAQSLVDEVSVESGRDIALTDLDGGLLIASARGAAAEDPNAVLDPLGAVIARAVSRPPTSYTTTALPRNLLAGREGADLLRIDEQSYQDVVLCSADAPTGASYPDGLAPPVGTSIRCRDLFPTERELAAMPPLVRLANEVAVDEYTCLRRRGAPAAIVRLHHPPEPTRPPLVTVHLPSNWAPSDPAGIEVVERAWTDCATAALTRRVAPEVAPGALLYLTETRTTSVTLLERIGGGRILLALVAVLLVVLAASLLASRQVLRPVRGLTDATRRTAEGELSTRVPVSGGDEVARLGRSFNDMAEALSDAAAQRRRMVGDVAHELRTPLGNIRAYLEAGQDGVLRRDDAWNDTLVEEVVVLQRIVDDLQVLAEADAGRLEVHPDTDDVVATVEGLLRSLAGSADAAGVGLVRSGADRALAPHDGLRVRQVFSNLVSNAIRHSPPGSTVTVDVSTQEDDGRPVVRVVVRDHGDGVPDEHLPHLFERFYRVDPSRSRATGGSGLGLAIVDQLVRAHHGRVSAARTEGGGLEVTVTLPQSWSASAADMADR